MQHQGQGIGGVIGGQSRQRLIAERVQRLTTLRQELQGLQRGQPRDRAYRVEPSGRDGIVLLYICGVCGPVNTTAPVGRHSRGGGAGKTACRRHAALRRTVGTGHGVERHAGTQYREFLSRLQVLGLSVAGVGIPGPGTLADLAVEADGDLLEGGVVDLIEIDLGTEVLLKERRGGGRRTGSIG
jgi:hypothetical protein